MLRYPESTVLIELLGLIGCTISLEVSCIRSSSKAVRISAPDGELNPLKVPEEWLLDAVGGFEEVSNKGTSSLMPLPREERSCRFRKVPNVLFMVPVPAESRLGSRASSWRFVALSGPGVVARVPLRGTAELGFELVIGVGEGEIRPSASMVASCTSEKRKSC